MTTEQEWRLLPNNLSPAEQDAVVATGSPALLRVIRQTRAIIGFPSSQEDPRVGPERLDHDVRGRRSWP